jgi:hypothetical protein
MESASWPKIKCKCSYMHFYKRIQECFMLETDYFRKMKQELSALSAKHMVEKKKKKNYSLTPLF